MDISLLNIMDTFAPIMTNYFLFQSNSIVRPSKCMSLPSFIQKSPDTIDTALDRMGIRAFMIQ